MAASLEQGFYVDPDSNRTFFVVETKSGRLLVPPWVKSKKSDWIKLERVKKKNGNISRKQIT